GYVPPVDRSAERCGLLARHSRRKDMTAQSVHRPCTPGNRPPPRKSPACPATFLPRRFVQNPRYACKPSKYRLRSSTETDPQETRSNAHVPGFPTRGSWLRSKRGTPDQPRQPKPVQHCVQPPSVDPSLAPRLPGLCSRSRSRKRLHESLPHRRKSPRRSGRTYWKESEYADTRLDIVRRLTVEKACGGFLRWR